MSLRRISAQLAGEGRQMVCKYRGSQTPRPFNPGTIKAMIEGPTPLAVSALAPILFGRLPPKLYDGGVTVQERMLFPGLQAEPAFVRPRSRERLLRYVIAFMTRKDG